MPQLCVYLDDETFETLQIQAKQRNLSLSKCAAEDIRAASQATGWPSSFLDLYGSIDDPLFERQPQGSPALDDDPSLLFE